VAKEGKDEKRFSDFLLDELPLNKPQ